MAYTTIDNPFKYFNTVLYSGTGSSNAVTGVGFQPDWVWGKQRSGTNSHELYDAVRGVNKIIYSDLTDAEGTNSNGVSAFNADGFTVAGNTSINLSGESIVAWNWLAGGTASSNTDGSITSSVSANTTAGFSIVSYTGNGTDGATIGHGLDTAPDVLLLKDRDNTRNWRVLHTGYGDASKDCLLNSNAAIATRADDFNSTYPSSTLITLGGDAAVNGNTTKYIIYAFSSVKGYSKHGSYTGNGSADGTFVYTGFKPAFVIVKKTNATFNWIMYDNKRDELNPNTATLLPDDSGAEYNTGRDIDFLSNGFKMRANYSGNNNSGDSYIYIAFAENPFVANDSGTAVPVVAG
jgi:hypothetical protein